MRPVHIVVVGHVDHGKSTLIGRLFHDAGVLPDGRIDQLTAAAAARGMPFEFANLTDGLQAERDQNVTIDTTQILFRWSGREVLFIDAPGHREFIRNMVTGASRADAALLVIDATDGVSEQTRRHALLLTILGVTRITVVINKIDTVSDDQRQARFATLSQEATTVLASVGLTPIGIVPTAASLGWNVVHRSPRLPWFSGPTIAESLNQLTLTETRHVEPEPTVFSVQDVYRRDARRWLVGRLESGSLRSGDAVQVLPAGPSATIDQVNGEPLEVDALTIRDALFVSRGDVLASEDAGLILAETLHARIFWLGRVPLSLQRRYEVRLGTQHADAEVLSIDRVIDASALVERRDRSTVPAHDVADVTLRLSRPLVVDPTGRILPLARIVIVDALPSPDLVGGGVVLPSTPDCSQARPPVASPRVTSAERVGGGIVRQAGDIDHSVATIDERRGSVAQISGHELDPVTDIRQMLAAKEQFVCHAHAIAARE